MQTIEIAAPAALETESSVAIETVLEQIEPETNALANEDAMLIALARKVIASSTSRPRGARGPKGPRANVAYRLVPAALATMQGTSIAPQKATVIDALAALQSDPSAPEHRGRKVVPEVEVAKIFHGETGKGLLKTKQDPWHVFAYYRTYLVQDGILVMVEDFAPVAA